MAAVEEQVNQDPKVFHVFLDLLETEGVMGPLCSLLKTSFASVKVDSRTGQPPSHGPNQPGPPRVWPSSTHSTKVDPPPVRIVPYEFTFGNYARRSKYKTTYIPHNTTRALVDVWYSQPFYSHTKGYKMCVGIAAQGTHTSKQKGSHLAVCICLMKGDYDHCDELKWPFRGRVTIKLLNQLDDDDNIQHTIDFDRTTPSVCCERVTMRDRAAYSVWKFDFIANNALDYDPDRDVQYLKDDRLVFRVESVQVDSAVLLLRAHTASHALLTISNQSMDLPDRVVPYEFTFSNYTNKCTNPQQWFSRSFYTCASGYRMCIEVVPQGSDEGKDTHVSIYVYMRMGEYDDNLKWPFRGDITIQLLNQLGDWCHHEEIIHFTETIPGMCCDRVTNGERADKGYGKDLFIPREELEYDPHREVQFLKDDILRFRVVHVNNWS